LCSGMRIYACFCCNIPSYFFFNQVRTPVLLITTVKLGDDGFRSLLLPYGTWLCLSFGSCLLPRSVRVAALRFDFDYCWCWQKADESGSICGFAPQYERSIDPSVGLLGGLALPSLAQTVGAEAGARRTRILMARARARARSRRGFSCLERPTVCPCALGSRSHRTCPAPPVVHFLAPLPLRRSTPVPS
jgi:hypothetical protein